MDNMKFIKITNANIFPIKILNPNDLYISTSQSAEPTIKELILLSLYANFIYSFTARNSFSR